MVQCGAVQCGVVWRGVAWRGAMRCGAVRCGVVIAVRCCERYGAVLGLWCGVVLCVVCEDRLDGNHLGAGGAAALAPVLRELTALQTLKHVRGCSGGWARVMGGGVSCAGGVRCGGTGVFR